MTNNEPQTQREEEPSAIGASMAWGCQPCTPRGARTAKPTAEQPEWSIGDQKAAVPSDVSAACCTSCDCREGSERPERMAAMASGCERSQSSAAEEAPVTSTVKSRPKGKAGPRPAGRSNAMMGYGVSKGLAH